MESIEDFNKRICKKMAYADHSEWCRFRMDIDSTDHWHCVCVCHVINSKKQDMEIIDK